jgi:ElaB/YqjD/DUF883 family membrane-anchored ribosome-binding protein
MTTITDHENQFSTTGTESSDGRLSGVRTKASETFSSARDRTTAAYGSVRERASDATRKTAETIDTAPGAALIGGLALGALAAVLLPKTRKEEELLGTYGRQINDKAKQAAQAAKDAGRSKLDELGLNKDTAKQKLNEVATHAKEAVKQSATAAAQAAKSTAQQGSSDQGGGQSTGGQSQGFSAQTLPTA